MNRMVLDTSVAIAWYFDESFSRNARLWLKRFQEEEVDFVVPDLHFIEFGNVLRTFTKRESISSKVAQFIHEAHLQSLLSRKNPDESALLETALEYNATVYDASFIQLALEEQIPLLTAERRTREWVRKLGNLAIHVK